MLSPHLEASLQRAITLAATHRHEYVTAEHLLLALTEDPDALLVFAACKVDIGKLQAELDRHLEEEMEVLISDNPVDPIPTLAFQRILQRAVIHVQSAGRNAVTGAHILAALFHERESHAVYYLTAQDVTRFDVVNFMSHGIAKDVNKASPRFPSSSSDHDRQEEDGPTGDYLRRFCVNLNDRAKAGKIDALIGREEEIARTIQVLCRRQKNNPLYLGEAGVGKTAIVQGLARQIVEGTVPDVLKSATVYALDMGSLIAGTRYRGDFEERLKGVLLEITKDPAAILFIDEIHTVIGAGATSSGSMDASNILKPALTNGEIRCIGSTTFKEYRAAFEKDHALARRFQKISIEEPSSEQAVAILSGLKPVYEAFHDVRFSEEAIKAAVDLSIRHLHDRKLPDKAIDVLDEIGAAQKLLGQEVRKKFIVAKDIEAMVAKIARIPASSVSQDDRTALAHLERDLSALVYGQEGAITALSSAIKLARAGLREPEKPIGNYLFSGPTGVGKTEVARQLAKTMGVELKRFDMSEYMEKHSVARLIGAPPGYVGFEQGGLLTDAVDQHPHAVVLLDEIEKAHPDLFNILLQIMDHGTLTDHNGKSVSFRNIVLIMTTNAGASEIARPALGFERSSREGEDQDAIKRLFTPEFRNRLDAIIPFKSLSQESVERVVDKFIMQLEAQLSGRNVTITLSAEARAWLAQKGYDPANGTRPLARLIQETIKRPLADEILFGKLLKGGVVTVSLDQGAQSLTLLCRENAPSDEGNAESKPSPNPETAPSESCV